LVPGVQVPVQAPLTQAWLVQAIALPHSPFMSQVWTPLFVQRVVAGAHSPVHWPATHAWSTQDTGGGQVPL
jgi:hypothetical protein